MSLSFYHSREASVGAPRATNRGARERQESCHIACRRGPAGEVSLRNLITLALVFVVLHGLIKVIPLYIKYLYFRQSVKESARMAGVKGDDEILRTILNRAEELGLPVTEENVTLERVGGENFQIRVHYFVEVKFVGGFYRRFNFDCQAQAP